MNCIICGKALTEKQQRAFKWNKQKYPDRLGPYCSIKCSRNDSVNQAKKKRTCIQKYGCENPSQSSEIKKKKEETALKHYGCRNPSQSQEIKQKKIETSIQHYGCKNPKQHESVKNKAKATSLQHYGVECTLCAPEVRAAIKQTLLDKYGTEKLSLVPQIVQKRKLTSIRRYGVDNPAKCQEVRKKMQDTCLKKYGVAHASKRKQVKQKSYITIQKLNKHCQVLFGLDDWQGSVVIKQYPVRCLFCGNSYNAKFQRYRFSTCPFCTMHSSLKQKQLASFITNNCDLPIKISQKTVLKGCGAKGGDLEIDIYIPSIKVGFQFNGTYWHAQGLTKEVGYHKNKTILCKQRGINLYHIWEKDWDNRRQLIQKAVKTILERRY